MSHDPVSLTSLLLPALAAVPAYAIFGFGRKNKEKEAIEEDTAPLEPLVTDTEEEAAPATDNEGETLPLLAIFPSSSSTDISETISKASLTVWTELGITERVDKDEESPLAPRLFAFTAVDSADAGREAVAAAILHLATAATQLGYSVLVIDSDLDKPSLHSLPLFQQRENNAKTPRGVAEFLRGEATKIEPLVRMARSNSELLLLPAGNVESEEGVLTGRATLERMLRLSGSFAEIVILLAPPIFAPSVYADIVDLLPRANGVVVAYPSVFSAMADTEAEERLLSMEAEVVGGIVVPPASFTDALGSTSTSLEPEDTEDPFPTVKIVYPEGYFAQEPEQTAPTEIEAEVIPEEEVVSEESLPQETEEVVPEETTPEETIQEEVIPEQPVSLDTVPEESVLPAMETMPVAVEPAVAESRPSFFTRTVEKQRGETRRDARRTVPVEAIPADTVVPVRQNRIPVTSTTTVAPVTITTPMTIYRPDVTLDFLPATAGTKESALTLRASIGGLNDTSGPALLLEMQTLAGEAKRLRAENPGTNATPDAPLLLLEAMTAETASDEATTLRLVVRESGASDAVTLLEATLETPDAMRIKSGAAKTSGVPPVRFEVTSEPDGTARFRATIPPLGNAPALFVDMERTTTPEGRFSRILLRLASP